VGLLKELADPVRLRVVDRLGHGGPATVSELAGALDVPMPLLSNHLRRLREAGLVTVSRSGRSVIYAIADESLFSLLPLLDRLTGVVTTAPAEADPADGRTCYAHLAGRLGVALYRSLRERGAVRDRPDGLVELGAEPMPLEIEVPGERRRVAFECFDATQHAPHLAGALGDELAAELFERGWIERGGGREVRVTAKGERGLRRTFGLAL
jgi:DNA-binding transcriptional ArsR family regulator